MALGGYLIGGHMKIQRCFVILFICSHVWSTPRETGVVVIGAGISGLTAAHELKKLGATFHVLELTPRVGGRIRTVKYERQGETLIADAGLDEFWESNPVLKLLKELDLPLRSDVALSSIIIDGRLYPLGTGDPIEFRRRLFNFEEMRHLKQFLETVSEILDKTERHPIPDDVMKLKELSLAEWVEKLKLPRKVSEWIRISIECEAGTAWHNTSALDGIAELHLFDAQGAGERSYRVIGGNVLLVEKLAERVGKDNISLGKRVTKVTTQNDHVLVTYLDTATEKSAVIKASHVISTIPLFRLFEVQFEPKLSPLKTQAIKTMGWGSYLKAHIIVPKKTERFWTLEGNSILPLLTDSTLGVLYEGNPDQDTQTKILSALMISETAERFNLMPLDQVRHEVKEALEKLWPGFSSEVQEIEFYRYHPRAVPAWGPGRSRYDELSEEIRRPEHRVYLAGDFTESSHSEGAVRSALRAVNQMQVHFDGPKNKKSRRH